MKFLYNAEDIWSSSDDEMVDVDDSDFFGDGQNHEQSSDDEPPRQIRRLSANTPRHNLAIDGPSFDNSPGEGIATL